MHTFGYPKTLLGIAREGTTYEISNILQHLLQTISVMFEHEKTHHGYVLLKPTAYMESLYPNSRGMLYAYTTDKLARRDSSDIDGAVLIFKAEELGGFPLLLQKKLVMAS